MGRIIIPEDRYPLAWPEGTPRAITRRPAAFALRKNRATAAALLRVSARNGEMTDKLIETAHRLMDEIVSLRHKLAKAKRLGLKACGLVNGSEFAAIAAALESLNAAAPSADRTSVHEALGVSPQDAVRAAMAHGVPCPTCGTEATAELARVRP